MSEEDEIQKVRSSEVHRGRKTPRSLRRDAERLESLLLSALKRGDRELFQQILTDLGQPAGSPEREKSLKVFDDYQRSR